MAERVITKNEISLNGVAYPITRPVQATLASQYPAKVLIGDISGDSQQRVSAIRWSDPRGGIGLKTLEGAADVDRSWYSTCHLRVRGHLTLPDLVTTTAASGASGVFDVGAIAELSEEIYAAFGTGIYKYDLSGDSWGSSLHSLAAIATDAITLRLADTIYMIFAYGTGYVDTDDGSSFNNRTTDVEYVAEWDGRLWGIDKTGQLRWTFSPSGTWVDDAQLPLPDDYVQDLFVARNATGEHILYASTKVGLFAHDMANNRFVATEMDLPFHDEAGAGVVRWRDAVYIPAGLGIYKYSIGGATAVITVVGPDRDHGLPLLQRGTIVRLANTHNDLIALVNNTAAAAASFDNFASSGMASHGSSVMSTEVGRSLILGWNEIGWQVLWESGAQTQSLDYALVSNAYSGYRLWWAHNEVVSYMSLPVNVVNPDEIADRDYAASSTHELPWFDAGQAEVEKLALRLKIEVRNASSNETVAVSYGTNYDDDTWTSLGTISSDGTTTYEFPDSTTPTGSAFRSMRFRVQLARGTVTTNSPDVLSITFEYRKKLEARYGWSCELDLTRTYKGNSPMSLRSSLLTAIESNPLVEFTFRDDAGNTRNFYGDIVQLTGMEFTGHDERGVTRLVVAEI